MKGAPDGEDRLAIDWPAASLGPRMRSRHEVTGRFDVGGPTPDWSACFPGEDEGVAKKRVATARFFDARDEAQPNSRAMSGPDVRRRVGMWRSRYDERSAG
jgi:hypothetical protein